MRLHESLLGPLAAAFFGYTFTFPAFPGQRYGPALFPQVVAVGIFLCGAILAVRGRRSGAPWLSLDATLREPRRLASFLAIPLAIGVYLLAAERLGFLPTAAVIVGVLAWWFGVRPLGALLLGVAASGLMHWFFASLMRVPLPRGWFMQVLFGG
jgi:putative tricarboxylic transport membrane protein